MEAFRGDCNNFGWGPLVNCVPLANGTSKSILNDFQAVTLNDVKLFSVTTWSDKTATRATAVFPALLTVETLDPELNLADQDIFYRRTRSKMIAARIENSLTTASLKTLFSKKKHFQWKDQFGNLSNDGPVMLQLLIESVNPSTRVGVSDLKQQIRSIKLVTFQYNVVTMTDKLTHDYNQILERSHTHEDFVLDIYTALLTGKNDVFNHFIQAEKDKWETGTDQLPDDIIEKAVQKYNNMVKQNIWIQSDSRDAKLIALTTKLEVLETQLKSNPSVHTTTINKNRFNIFPWRMKKVGPSITVDGKTWWWCPEHKFPGKYDGLYVNHKPEQHADWKANKDKDSKARKERNSTPSDNNNSNSKDTTDTKLTLSENMKAAMVTNFNCTSEEASQLWSSVVTNGTEVKD